MVHLKIFNCLTFLALESLANKMKSTDPESLNGELLVRFFGKRPGWKESNFQVFLKTIQLIDSCIDKCGFSQEGVTLLVPSVIDKLSDIKIGPTLSNLLSTCAEYVGLDCILNLLVENGKSQKNPKVSSEILKWMQANLYMFGNNGISSSTILEFTKEHLQSSNPIIRSSAVKLAATLFQFYGQGISLIVSIIPNFLKRN